MKDTRQQLEFISKQYNILSYIESHYRIIQKVTMFDTTTKEEYITLLFKLNRNTSIIMDCITEYEDGRPSYRDVYFDIFDKHSLPENPLYTLSWRHSDETIEYHYENVSKIIKE